MSIKVLEQTKPLNDRFYIVQCKWCKTKAIYSGIEIQSASHGWRVICSNCEMEIVFDINRMPDFFESEEDAEKYYIEWHKKYDQK